MNMKTFQIRSEADGLMLSVMTCAPDGPVKGLVQIAHGMAEYKERYTPFLKALAAAGYAALIADHRGHGASVAQADDKGWFGDVGAQGLIADMRQLTRWFQRAYPEAPLCLFGHSMGSLAVRAYARADDSALSALVVCGCPGENPAARAGLALVRALKRARGGRYRSKLVHGMVNGAFSRKFKAEASPFSWINSDPEAVSAYEADEQCGFMFTLNGYEALFTLMRMAYARDGWAMHRPGMPVLFLSGGDDPCMISREKLDAAAERMRAVGYGDVSVTVYEKFRHEILLEPECEKVFSDVVAFLKRHLVP